MANRKEIWVVRDVPANDQHPEGRSFWTKIGAAFENRDGSYTLVFDALPIDGRAQLRDPLPPREQNDQQDAPGAPASPPARDPGPRPAAGRSARGSRR